MLKTQKGSGGRSAHHRPSERKVMVQSMGQGNRLLELDTYGGDLHGDGVV